MKTIRVVIEAESGENLEFLQNRMIETWNWYGRQPIMEGIHNDVLYQVVDGKVIRKRDLLKKR